MSETSVGNRPSVGRIVHYGPRHLAAIITAVWSDPTSRGTWPERIPPFAFPAEVEHLTQ